MDKTKRAIHDLICCISHMWEDIKIFDLREEQRLEIEEKRKDILQRANDLMLTFDVELDFYRETDYMRDYKKLIEDAKELSTGSSMPSFEKTLQFCLKAYLAAKTGGLVKDE